MSARVETRFTSTGAQGVQRDAAKVKGSIDGVGKAGQGAAGAMSKLSGAFAALGGAAAAGAILKGAADLTMLGDSAIGARTALEALAGRGNADEYIDAIRESANGAVSELEAMRIANGFLGPGLAETADEAAEFARIARILGGTFRNLGAADAAEELQLMLSNMSVQRLDSFGISAAEVRNRIAELQAETPGLSREVAFMNAVMEIGSQRADELGGATEGLSTEMQILKAEVDNSAQAIGEFLAGRITPAVSGLNDVRDASEQYRQELTAQVQELAANSDSLEEYEAGLEALNEEMSFAQNQVALNNKLLESSEEIYQRNARAVNVAAAEQSEYARARQFAARNERIAAEEAQEAARIQQEATETLEFAQEALETYNEELNFQAGLQQRAQASIEELRNNYGALSSVYEVNSGLIGALNLEQSEELRLLNELGLATGQVSELEIERGNSLRQLTNLYAEGRISAEEYAAATQAIGEGADPANVLSEALAGANESLNNLDASNTEMIRDLINETGGGAEAMAAALDEAQQANFEAVQESATGLTGELDEIVARLDAVEEPRNTQLSADGSAVFSTLDAIERRIRELQDLSLPGGGGGGGTPGGNAVGGPIEEGEASIVGEGGRELFIPDEDGFILPNYETEDTLSGGGNTQNNYQVSAPITIPNGGQPMNPAAIQRAVEAAINDAIQRAQRGAQGATGVT